jgi:uncharacterized membrane protein YqaE (UPF0057 family)
VKIEFLPTINEFRHKGFCSLANIIQNFLVRHFGMFQGVVLAQFADVIENHLARMSEMVGN